MIQDANLPALLRELDWLKPNALHICRLHTYPDYRRVAKDGRLLPAQPRMCTWGIAWKGLCLTQPLQEEKEAGEGCSLSRILIPDAPERYFLSAKQMEKLLYFARTDTGGMSVLPEGADFAASEDDDGCGKEAA